MEQTKTCHGYDPKTGEYTGERIAFLSPVEGAHPLPAHSVWEAPPYELPPGSAWVMGKHAWEPIEDNRGTPFYLDGKLYTMEVLGALPDGFRPVAPAPDEAPPISADEAMRAQRDKMLAASDILALRCLERGEPVPAELVKYRQELRDLPNSPQWPEVPFPTAPGV